MENKEDQPQSPELVAESISFKSPEKVHEFFLDVIQTLVQDRTQLASLFKDLQQSYSQLYFYSHFLLDTVQSLIPLYYSFEEFQDAFTRENIKLKQENAKLSQKVMYESYLNREYSQKLFTIESRQSRLNSELVDCKVLKSSLEKRVSQMGKEMQELLDRLKAQQDAKKQAIQELEGFKREKDFIGQQIREFRALLIDFTTQDEEEEEVRS